MLSKYTFLAPDLIRVSGEVADYAHLITCASPLGVKFSSTHKMLSMYTVNLFGVLLSILFGTKTGQGGGRLCPPLLLSPHPKSI